MSYFVTHCVYFEGSVLFMKFKKPLVRYKWHAMRRNSEESAG